MLHHLHHNAHADRALCNGSADMGSIVDRLLAVAEMPETDKRSTAPLRSTGN